MYYIEEQIKEITNDQEFENITTTRITNGIYLDKLKDKLQTFIEKYHPDVKFDNDLWNELLENGSVLLESEKADDDDENTESRYWKYTEYYITFEKDD